MDILNNPQTIEKTTAPEIEHVEKEKLEYKLLGQCLLTPGLSLFSFNLENGEIRKIEVKKKVISSVFTGRSNSINHSETVQRKVTVDNKLIYFEALNIKTAVKKVTRFLEGKTKQLFNLRLIKPE